MQLFPKVIQKDDSDTRNKQINKKMVQMASFWERVELGDLVLESESVSLQSHGLSKSLKLHEPLFFKYEMDTKSNTCGFMEFL